MKDSSTMELDSLSPHGISQTGSQSQTVIKNDGILPSLTNLTAQLILVTAGFMVFTEVLHNSVPIFYFHEYLFNFLICGGIICLAITYIRAWSYRLQESITADARKNKFSSHFSFGYVENCFPNGISKFFRIGALIFGLVAICSCCFEALSIYSMPADCIYGLNSIQPILRGIFTIFQMFFLFLNFQDIINTFGWFRQAAMMHMISTNLAIWIRIALWESTSIWLDANHKRHNSSINWHRNQFNFTVHTLESDSASSNYENHMPSHKVHFAENCYWSKEIQEIESMLAYNLCLRNSTIGKIWYNISPYMYPVIIQYCISISGIIYLTWSNLHTKSSMHFQSNYLPDRLQNNNNTSVYAGSTKGTFVGLLILLIGIIITILYFTLPEEVDLNMTFVVGNLQCVIFSISSLAAVVGLYQLRNVASKSIRLELPHVIFQELGILAVYSFGVCNAIAGSISNSSSKLLFMVGILLIVQVITQALFLHQVLRKILVSEDNSKKPKAQIVIMLAIVNAMLWILDSFVTQSQAVNQIQIHFFGNIAWPVICKVLFPLMTFYRFHSSVLLLEAWRNCYIA